MYRRFGLLSSRDIQSIPGHKKRLVCKNATPGVCVVTNARTGHRQKKSIYLFPALLNAEGVNSLEVSFALKLYGWLSLVKPIAR